MMPADRTEYAQPVRSDGLIFDWRNHRTPRLAKLGMWALAMGVFVFPLSMVRIDMGKPPVQESQGASVMMLTPSNDPMHWLDKARDLGPFPSRYDPAESDFSRAVVDDVIESARKKTISENQPRYQDLPADPVMPPVPLVTKGARVIPPVAAPKIDPLKVGEMRLMPVIYPLSMQADELPLASPPFDPEVTSEMAIQPWRFLLQVSPDGTVLHAVALIGHNTPGRPDLITWLQEHRFPGHDGDRDRWVAVAVTFQNRPANGADDP